MSLASHYQPGSLALSFELFPPKTAEGERSLFQHVAQLVEFRPSFITCTYGAGGSTRDKTLRIISDVRQRFGLPVASHLTCVGSTVDQLRSYLAEAAQQSIDYVVALRGDPPQGESRFRPAPGGLRYASELVQLIRAEFPQFGIAVAGYPETHREAPSPDDDLAHLKHKVDCGADIVITQLFYDNADFWAFRDRYLQAGITVPLIPGILPITSLAQIQRITSLCGARLPQQLIDDLNRRTDEAWQFDVGVAFATQQVQELIEAGAPGLHFYVLNKSQAASAVLGAALPDR